MIIPVRCFSCGKVVGHLWDDFIRMTEEEGKSVKDALDELKIERFCCRGVMVSHVEMVDEISAFN